MKEFNFVKTLVAPDEVKNIKVTSISPSWYHFRYNSGYAFPSDVYATDEEFFEDVAKVYRTELQLLYDAGARHVAVDDPNLACELSGNVLHQLNAE